MPSGWEEHWDETHGRTYYYCERTGETTWEPPPDWTEPTEVKSPFHPDEENPPPSVEMANRGQGGPWTGGPGGLNWNGKANMRVRSALRAQDWQQELARLISECDAIRAAFV